MSKVRKVRKLPNGSEKLYGYISKKTKIHFKPKNKKDYWKVELRIEKRIKNV